MTLTEFLTGIADAIRYAEKSTEDIAAPDFNGRIKALGSGGGSELPACIHTGTFTVAQDTVENIVVEHGFRSIPHMICFFIDEYNDRMNGMTLGGFSYAGTGIGCGVRTSGYFQVNVAYQTISMDDSSITFNRCREDSMPFRSGYTYRWFAWGIE